MRRTSDRLRSDPRRAIRLVSALIPAVLFLGCGSEPGSVNSRNFTATKAPSPSENLVQFSTALVSAADAAPAATPPVAEASKVEALPSVPRKIIYNAQVALVVESLNGFEAKVDKLVKDSGGYVSQTDQSSVTDAQRNGSWTIRVPVERFNSFLASVSRLGELQRSHLDSQDVTMEFYDIEARIANKQKEEARLIKHLADSTGKLEDILAVERELTRVRGEIEQMQGRIRYLGNLSALSTVTLTVSEVRNYVPPVRPTFAGQIARTFHESLETLIGFAKGTVLFAAAIAPWLPLLLVLALLLRWTAGKLGRLRPRTV